MGVLEKTMVVSVDGLEALLDQLNDINTKIAELNNVVMKLMSSQLRIALKEEDID